MAEKLTPQQQQAVEDRGGKLLVSAAAGSGKTKVLVDRLLKYIRDPADPANIDEFLIITYTKAAASELRSKIAAKLSEHIAAEPSNRHLQRQLQRLYLTKISTVHAFCSDILREYAYLLDISGDFRVADENEVRQLRERAVQQVLEEAYAAIGEDSDLQAFVDTQGLGRTDALVPEIMLSVYDSAMCHTDPQSWCDNCVSAIACEGVTDPSQTPWGRWLMDDLFSFLDGQIPVMETCAARVAAVPGLEKPAALLSDTVNQLRHLRQSTTWDQVVRRRKIEYGRLVFPKKADDPSVTEPVKAVRNACKDMLEKKLRLFADPAERVLEDLSSSAAAARGLMSLVTRFREVFSALKRRRRVLDFSDLEHKTLDLLLGKQRSGPTAAAREIGARFREIMVDEYQDSNGVQDAIFSSLTQRRQNLFMVGDVKQSIYQFRLADPAIFLEKYNAYALAGDAAPGQGRKVLLSANFRSGTGVIEGANHVFRVCMSKAVGDIDYTEAEELREGVPHIPLDEPEVELYGIRVQEDTYAEEAAFVADRICALLDGEHHVRDGETLRPIRPEDIVILLRSPGSVGQDFADALEMRGVRCASGVGTDLLQTQEVANLRSLLQVISNPRQDIPLLAVLASPVFGFTADELAAVRVGERYSCIYDALRRSEMPKAMAFFDTLSKLRHAAAMGTLPELFERIYNLTRMDTVYASMEDGQLRSENLHTFYRLAVAQSQTGCDLDRFLTYLDAQQERGLPSATTEGSTGCVTIMSIHKSKGLEFPVVFLAGLSKRFNSEDQHKSVLCHKEMGLGLSCLDTAQRVRYPGISKSAIGARMAREAVSEEMRVLYVAMTRARDRLIMTYASEHLEAEVSDLSLRMTLTGRDAITANVGNCGSWVLYAALHRTEAGELFALGTNPGRAETFERPWRIRVVDGYVEEAGELPEQETVEPEPAVNPETLAQLRDALSFRYPHIRATVTPSKQTATQLKGRLKDEEAAEKTPRATVRTWRKPSFVEQRASGTSYGSAVHMALQHIHYDACGDVRGVEGEIRRLVDQGYLTAEQGALIPCGALARFFATEFSRKLCTGKVLREFKFSILDSATQYAPGLDDEQVLLQGVIDCALVESDGITVLDFKTDYVTEDTLDAVTAGYAPQVQVYADAISRIYGLPVKAKALYFFHLSRLIYL